MAALDAGVPLRDVQIAARHANPRTTTIYDHDANTSTGTPPIVVYITGGQRPTTAPRGRRFAGLLAGGG
jgi:hypothetical protein